MNAKTTLAWVVIASMLWSLSAQAGPVTACRMIDAHIIEHRLSETLTQQAYIAAATGGTPGMTPTYAQAPQAIEAHYDRLRNNELTCVIISETSSVEWSGYDQYGIPVNRGTPGVDYAVVFTFSRDGSTHIILSTPIR